MTHVNAVSFTILVVLFAVVTLVGFAAARWRRAEDMVHSTVFVVDPSKRVRLITMYPMHLKDWGLGGRGFGTLISWFLLGGDLAATGQGRGTADRGLRRRQRRRDRRVPGREGRDLSGDDHRVHRSRRRRVRPQ